MALIAPLQERSVDPYSNRRFSSVLNRITRIASGGRDVILFPNQSFRLTFLNYKEVEVSNGICIKDDVLIHITEDFNLDFSDNDYYVDDSDAMSTVGTYFIVLSYIYARKLPAPVAQIQIIRDTGSPGPDPVYALGLYYKQEGIHTSSVYIFLGSVTVEWNAGESRNEVTAVNYNTPEVRPVASGDWIVLDGGEL